jgi:hypothetical protein
MSYADDVKIFLNIMAQSPDGLSDPQLISKFSKAKATLHVNDSMNAMQAQDMVSQNVMSNTPIGQPSQGMPQEPLGATNTLNQPPMEGQGELNLP